MTTVRKNKKGWLFLVVAVAIFLVVTFGDNKGRKYDKAADYMWDGNYEAAIEIYEELGSYENSQTLLLECQYQLADRMLQYGDYRQAMSAFQVLEDYSNSKQKLQECYMGLAEEATNAQDYEKTISWLLLANDHPDAAAKLDEAYYAYGHQLFLEGRHVAAQEQFDQIQVLPEYAKPHFADIAQAREYLKEQSDMLIEDISCYICWQPLPPAGHSLWDMAGNYVPFQSGSVFYDDAQKTLHITAKYYPGKRILYAWRTGDHAILTEDELQAMKVAEELVEKAKAKSDTPMDIELYLYNWLCNHVEYESPNMDVDTETYMSLRQLNCLGALLDGKANCQGYTDAFYLLGNMAGFEVYRISGLGEGEGHCWNGIMLDGKLYIVDVTFGDADNMGKSAKTYTWFNVPYDPEIYDIDGGTEIFPELVTGDDMSESYYTYKKCVFSKLSDASYYLLRQYKKNGKGWAFAVVEDQEVTTKQLEKSIKNNRKKAGVGSYSYTYMLENYNGNTYIVLKWK